MSLYFLDPLALPASPSYKRGGAGAEPTRRRGTRNKKTKLKRAKQIESSDSTVSHQRLQQLRPPLLNPTSWSPSDTSQSTFSMTYPAMMPGYPLQVYPRTTSIDPCTEATLTGFGNIQGTQAPPCPPSIHPAAYTTPMVTPIVALVLPNCMYPQMAPGPLPPQPVYQAETGGFPTQTQSFGQSVFPGQNTFTVPPSFSAHNQFNPQNHFPPEAGSLTASFHFPPSAETPKAPVEGQSRSSTPKSGGVGGQASPPLFQSRCSSPLNLLELELSVERQDSTGLSTGGQGNNTTEREKGASGNQTKERELKQVNKETNFFLFALFFLFSFSLRVSNAYYWYFSICNLLKLSG